MRIAVALTVVLAATLAADDQKNPGDAKKAFQGTWTIVDVEKGKAGDEPVTAPTVVFKDDTYSIRAGDKVIEAGTFTVDTEKTPHRIEVVATDGMDKGQKWHGIYELKGDTLRAMVGPTDKDPPAKLGKPQPGERAFTLKRAKQPKE
jgi:uncharacterized protein (TIGR03067 family)